MPLSDILKDLTTDNYPPLQSFFISSTPYSDPNSYNYTTPFTPTTSQSHSQPLRRVRFLRRRKLRYMEIWLQMAQVFRRLDKIHDARMACLEAQRVERGNADVEFEVVDGCVGASSVVLSCLLSLSSARHDCAVQHCETRDTIEN